MKFMPNRPQAPVFPRGLAIISVVAVFGLAGCGSLFGSKKPEPAALGANPASVPFSQAWTARVGAIRGPMQPVVNGNTVTVAGSDGSVAVLDAATGAERWRASVGAPLAAGVGSDGQLAAVVTQANDLVALSDGREVWRQKLQAQVFTAPLVAGGRVFVLAADRSVNAFDGQTGRKLWQQQRPGEPLVLRQPGVMLPVGDTLVVGLSGRLAGLNPNSGAVRWEAPIATPRGINDVERLVDLVGSVARLDDVVCARAFQASVGCVNTERGSVLWTKPANGYEGISGDAGYLFGTEANGHVLAWRRSSGERAWTNERLQYRSLTAPLAMGRTVAVGDSTGLVHVLSRDEGTPVNRLTTDGSGIAAAPVLAEGTLVVVTRNGGVFGFRPQ